MLGVALFVFRGVLEAALIVCAATRGVPQRGRYVLGGIGLGIAGAVTVAVVMIAWHVVWISSHGRGLAKAMQGVSGAVKSGSTSLSLLLMVAGLAVLREGSEIVLFLYGMAVGGIGAASLAVGAASRSCALTCYWSHRGPKSRPRSKP